VVPTLSQSKLKQMSVITNEAKKTQVSEMMDSTSKHPTIYHLLLGEQ